MTNTSSDAKRLSHAVAKIVAALLVIALLPVAALLVYSETVSQAENIGPIERYQILDSLPKEKGEEATLASGVKVRRIDAVRKNESSELIEMGGVSAKWEFVEGSKKYKMLITFDNIPKAIFYTILHPDTIDGFVDIYENDRDNAYMVKEAAAGGIEAIRYDLPDLPDSDFEE